MVMHQRFSTWAKGLRRTVAPAASMTRFGSLSLCGARPIVRLVDQERPRLLVDWGLVLPCGWIPDSLVRFVLSVHRPETIKRDKIAVSLDFCHVFCEGIPPRDKPKQVLCGSCRQ